MEKEVLTKRPADFNLKTPKQKVELQLPGSSRSKAEAPSHEAVATATAATGAKQLPARGSLPFKYCNCLEVVDHERRLPLMKLLQLPGSNKIISLTGGSLRPWSTTSRQLHLPHGSKPIAVDLIAPRQLLRQHGREPLAVDLIVSRQLQQLHGREHLALHYFAPVVQLLHGIKPMAVDFITLRQLQDLNGRELLAGNCFAPVAAVAVATASWEGASALYQLLLGSWNSRMEGSLGLLFTLLL